MTAINLGLCFEQCTVSRYGRMRQVFAANPAIKGADIRQAIKGLPPPFFLSKDHPERYCTSRFDHCRSSRNCPDCAKMVFHSWLYEMPWVSRCPVHTCALVERCPFCEQRWTLSPVLRSSCPVCGFRVVGFDNLWGKLARQQQFLPHKQLAELMLNLRQKGVQVAQLIGDSYHVSGTEFLHPLFPCVLEWLSVSSELLQGFGVRIPAYQHVEAPLSARPPWRRETRREIRRWSALRVNQVLRAFFKQKKLRGLQLSQAARDQYETFDVFSYNPTPVQNPSERAYRLYQALATTTLSKGEPQQTTTWRYGRLFFCGRPYPPMAVARITSLDRGSAPIGWLNAQTTAIAYSGLLWQQLHALDRYCWHVARVAEGRHTTLQEINATMPPDADWTLSISKTPLVVIQEGNAHLFMRPIEQVLPLAAVTEGASNVSEDQVLAGLRPSLMRN